MLCVALLLFIYLKKTKKPFLSKCSNLFLFTIDRIDLYDDVYRYPYKNQRWISSCLVSILIRYQTTPNFCIFAESLIRAPRRSLTIFLGYIKSRADVLNPIEKRRTSSTRRDVQGSSDVFSQISSHSEVYKEMYRYLV